MIRFRDFSIKTKLSYPGGGLQRHRPGALLPRLRQQRHADDQGGQSRRVPGHGQHAVFPWHALLNSRDAKAARLLLHSLESQPAIDHAALLDADGQGRGRPTTKTRSKPATLPVSTGEGYAFTDAGMLEFRHPILDNGKQVGTVLLCANMNGLRAQLHDYGKISLIVMVFALNVVVFFTSCMQKVIAGPILDLAETARRISEEGDYSVRASWDSTMNWAACTWHST